MNTPKWWSRHRDAFCAGGFGFVAATILLTLDIAGLF